jgi:hypothetical protein
MSVSMLGKRLRLLQDSAKITRETDIEDLRIMKTGVKQQRQSNTMTQTLCQQEWLHEGNEGKP